MSEFDLQAPEERHAGSARGQSRHVRKNAKKIFRGAHESGRRNAEGFLILFQPDSNRRLWDFTKSADLPPLKAEALAGFPARSRYTAGGEFHPALRTSL